MYASVENQAVHAHCLRARYYQMLLTPLITPFSY